MKKSDPNESIERIRTAMLLQLNAARGLLEIERGPSDADVHEARKAIKRARALVRLLRHAIAPRAFAEVNAALRDAGRFLSAARDAKVLEDTLAAVVARDAVPPARARRLRVRVGDDRPPAEARAMLDARARRASRTLLERVSRRVARLRPRADGAHLLDVGLERIRRRGRRAMRVAHEERTAESLHEWRKQVQNYWHALEAHPGRAARATRASIAAARELSRALGEDHDLAMLERKLKESQPRGRSDGALQKSIARRRARRQGTAFELGRTLYGRRN